MSKENDIMNNRYVIDHQAMIDLSDIQMCLTRIRAEGDEHSSFVAKEAEELVRKIQNAAIKI